MNKISRDPVRVNLVEQEGWKKWDPAHIDLDWILNAAFEDFRHMDESTLEGLVDDLWSSSPGKGKRKPRRQLMSEELEYLAGQLKDYNETLEPVQRAIVDAAQWMYELASIPVEHDIRESMEKAAEEFKSNPEMTDDLWGPILHQRDSEEGPKGWFPGKRDLITEEQLVDQLTKEITFDRNKGAWDRYIVFDFWSAPAVFRLLKKHPDFDYRVHREFEHIRSGYLSDFFKALEKEMEGVDVNNRTDWDKNWKSMLSDPSVVSEAQEAIKMVLKDMPEAADES